MATQKINRIPLDMVEDRATGKKLNEKLDDFNANLAQNTSQLSDIAYNAKLFGAQGGGLVDESTLLQNVIDYAPAYSEIILPKGTYLLNTALNINKPLRLVSYEGAVLTRNGTNNLITIDTLIVGKVTIEGITLDGKNTKASLIGYKNIGTKTTSVYVNKCIFKNAGTNGYAAGNRGTACGIRIENFDTILIENSTFDVMEYFGVYCLKGNTLIMKYNVLSNCGIYGMSFDDGLKSIFDHNHVLNCGYGGFDSEGITQTNDFYIIWTNNIVENCGNDDGTWGGAIVPGNYTRGIIEGNQVINFNMTNKKNYLHAIPTARNSILKIINNKIDKCGGHGICVSSTDQSLYKFIIENNYVSEANLRGITVYFTATATVTGNTVRRSQQEGIYMDNTNTCNVFGNKVDGNSQAGNGLYSGIVIRDSSYPNVVGNIITGSNHKVAVELLVSYGLLTMRGNQWSGTKFTNTDGGGKILEMESVRGIRHMIGTGAPTANTWSVGDRVVNNAPAVGSPKAWVCTVAGTPGTWVSEGNL